MLRERNYRSQFSCSVATKETGSVPFKPVTSLLCASHDIDHARSRRCGKLRTRRDCATERATGERRRSVQPPVTQTAQREDDRSDGQHARQRRRGRSPRSLCACERRTFLSAMNNQVIHSKDSFHKTQRHFADTSLRAMYVFVRS